ncbi:MAG: ArsB/NhaD family transporter [Firmicutes bacterium]|nr:ArsB/NhaD family transporter [Bacillota bacterium]
MEPKVQLIVAIIIFIGTYALIMSEKIHRSLVALGGGILMLLLGILNFEEAKRAIELNTIGLLIGMMIIVGITRKTGVFEYLAIKAARWAQGRPFKIMLALSAITALVSALLDNVTTVLLVVPVTFSIVYALELNPIPFLISEIMASNIGGTATLVGDPPNIMIGSAVPALTFMKFATNLAPINVVIFFVNAGLLCWIFRKELIYNEKLAAKMNTMNPIEKIKDFALMKKSLWVIGFTIVGFVLQQFLHWDSSVVALAGAVVLMIIAREEPEEVFLSVEWPSIFFFVGLFVLVGGLEKVGVIRAIAGGALKLTGGAMVTTSMLILWLSAISSALIDNIPFVATMIPLIKTMGQMGAITNLEPFWWALSLGACLGGNGTLIGASANVIVAGIAEKNGVIMSFWGFTKVAFPLMIVSILISTAYIYLAYLV